MNSFSSIEIRKIEFSKFIGFSHSACSLYFVWECLPADNLSSYCYFVAHDFKSKLPQKRKLNWNYTTKCITICYLFLPFSHSKRIMFIFFLLLLGMGHARSVCSTLLFYFHFIFKDTVPVSLFSHIMLIVTSLQQRDKHKDEYKRL